MAHNQTHTNNTEDLDLRLVLAQLKSDLKSRKRDFLNQKYLALKLSRTEGAICKALDGKPGYDELRKRIVIHFAWIEKTYLNKKKAA